VCLVRTDVSEERVASIPRAEKSANEEKRFADVFIAHILSRQYGQSWRRVYVSHSPNHPAIQSVFRVCCGVSDGYFLYVDASLSTISGLFGHW
jgi:hypothetical protein